MAIGELSLPSPVQWHGWGRDNLLTTCSRQKAWPWDHENWFCPSPAIEQGRAGPAHHLDRTVELSLVVDSISTEGRSMGEHGILFTGE